MGDNTHRSNNPALNAVRFRITEEIRKNIDHTIHEEIQSQVNGIVHQMLRGRIEHHVNKSVHDLIEKRISTLFTGSSNQVKALARGIIQEPGFYTTLTQSVLVHVQKSVDSFLGSDIEERFRRYTRKNLKDIWRDMIVKEIQED
jgi:hypothetical protein